VYLGVTRDGLRSYICLTHNGYISFGRAALGYGYFDNNGYFHASCGHGAFTGTHKYVSDDATLEPGDAVKLVNRKVVKCSVANDKRCIGVIAGKNPMVPIKMADDSYKVVEFEDSFGIKYTLETDNCYYVAAVGDALTETLPGAKICDEGGPVEDGDFLCTSSIPGYFMKQDDDLVHTYTVAQARENITFDVDGKAEGCYIYFC